jgi:hypothetical protein
MVKGLNVDFFNSPSALNRMFRALGERVAFHSSPCLNERYEMGLNWGDKPASIWLSPEPADVTDVRKASSEHWNPASLHETPLRRRTERNMEAHESIRGRKSQVIDTFIYHFRVDFYWS